MKLEMRKTLPTAAVILLLLGGCVSPDAGNRELLGALLGAAGGGAVAANNINKGDGRSLGVAVGAVLGSVVGADVGRSLDRANKLYNWRAQRYRNHSQQVPVAGFAPAPKRRGSWFGNTHGDAPIPQTIRDAKNCRSLEGGLRPTFACRNSAGQWFVLQ